MSDQNHIDVIEARRRAMAAGVTNKLWEVSDIVALIEAKEAEQPVKRGPYKKGAN